MPQPEKWGFFKTLNRMGYMSSKPDPFSLALIHFASKSSLPMLEIGAAYGVATLAALKKSCRVIANDMGKRHLQILWKRTPARFRSRLTLLPGRIPDGISLPANSIGAVLACRVLHFLDGPNLELAVRKIYKWLAPQSYFVMVAETPYLKNWLPFLPVYEKRCKRNDPWPIAAQKKERES